MSKNTAKNDIRRALVIAMHELDKASHENDHSLSKRLDDIKDAIEEGKIRILDLREEK